MSSVGSIANELRVDELLARFPELRVTYAAASNDHVSFDALAGMDDANLEKLLAQQATASPGLDRRGQGAFLISALSYSLASICAVVHLHLCAFPDLAPDTIMLRISGDGAHHTTETLDLRVTRPPSTVEGVGKAPEFAGQLVARLTPMVERLFRATRLARRAQWRLVGDMLAAAFLHYGKHAGCAGLAEADALAILAPGASPMSNRQVGFQSVSVVVPSGRTCSDRFIKRGGCCRYYTADNGSYCSTCVLRKPGDQQAQLQQYLLDGI